MVTIFKKSTSSVKIIDTNTEAFDRDLVISAILSQLDLISIPYDIIKKVWIVRNAQYAKCKLVKNKTIKFNNWISIDITSDDMYLALFKSSKYFIGWTDFTGIYRIALELPPDLI